MICMKYYYGLNGMGLIKNLILNFIVQVMILNKNRQNLVFFKEKIELNIIIYWYIIFYC